VAAILHRQGLLFRAIILDGCEAWQINLAGTIPGWTRFAPTQELIDKAARTTVDAGLARLQATRAAPNNVAEQERLFREFLEWSKQQKR